MISRRKFTTRLLCAASGLVGTGLLPAAEPAGPGLAPERRRSLLAALAAEDKSYDPAEQMPRKAMHGPGYHTTLEGGFVHSTREALTYAAALLDTGEPGRLERAQAILKRVIRLQDQNPISKSYGIWSWYLEEPLDKMSPPDWNWADFCGVQLLAAWIGHRHRLDPSVAALVRDSITRASRSIQKRNVGPGYTNIAIMGTYVTLVAGEQLQLDDILAYGKARLRRLHQHVMEQGSLTEYNSPTYSVVALAELSRLLMHARDEADLRLVRELHELAWRHVATHFHAPTRQWAGPHSRSYGDDLRRNQPTLAFLEAACGGTADLIANDPLPLGLDACRLHLECPAPLVRHFRELTGPRSVVETFIRAEPARAGARVPVVGTTWLHPHLALGTVNRGNFWNQSRPLLAYWGDSAKPVILRARFLKNNRDFCSALIFSAQHEGSVLSTVVLATDYGDFHPSLDRVRESTIKAQDLRLRFEWAGEPDELAVSVPEGATQPALIAGRGVKLRLHRLAGGFDGQNIRWEQSGASKAPVVDAVFYAGTEKTFNLAALDASFAAFALEFGTENRPTPAQTPVFQVRENRARATWETRGRQLEVEVSLKPGPLAVLNDTTVAKLS